MVHSWSMRKGFSGRVVIEMSLVDFTVLENLKRAFQAERKEYV